jgi:hypothetical protein
VPHDPYGDAADPRAAQDAAWRQIVENYGDRPLLDDDREVAEDTTADDAPAPRIDRPASTPEPRPAPRVRAEPAEEHYVPPPPPHVSLAEPRRLLGWLGLLGVPVLVLLALVAKVTVPSWLGVMLMAWFVGGFVYLVASMRSGPRDDDDDGAVV